MTPAYASYSKTAPPASRYDDPGFPYARLLNATGCPSGPASFSCLQNVPFEVGITTYGSETKLNSNIGSRIS